MSSEWMGDMLKVAFWTQLAVLAVLPPGCTSDFDDCEAMRSCTAYRAGSAGVGAGQSGAGSDGMGASGKTSGLGGDQGFAEGASGAPGHAGPDQGGAGSESATNGNAGAAGSSDPGNGGDGGADANVPGLTVITEPSLRTQRGGSSDFVVSLKREGGFSGAVEVTVEGLPVGVGADPITLNAAEDEAELTIVALNTAMAGGPTPIAVRAEAVDSADVVAQVSVDFYVAELAGAADSSFGSDGFVREKITNRELDVVTDVAIDSQGRIVVAGEGQQASGFLGWVLRLTPDGAFDASFARDGVFDEFGGQSSGTSNVVLAAEAPLVTATTYDGVTGTSYLRKFSTTGAVDTSYGTGGDVDLSEADVTDLMNWGSGVMISAWPLVFQALDARGDPIPSFHPTSSAIAGAVAIDSQERVLYGGASTSGPFTAGRFTTSGDADASFGTSGVATFPMAGSYVDYVAKGLRTYPDGGAVLLAQARADGGDIYQNRVVLIRFDANGNPDADFGTNGVTVVTEEGIAADLAVQNDGKVVVLYANRVESDFAVTYALARYGLDGNLDSSFASFGVLDVDRVYADEPYGLAHDAAAGRLIVYGYVSGAGISLLRLWL